MQELQKELKFVASDMMDRSGLRVLLFCFVYMAHMGKAEGKHSLMVQI